MRGILSATNTDVGKGNPDDGIRGFLIVLLDIMMYAYLFDACFFMNYG